MTEPSRDQSPPAPRYDFDSVDLDSDSVHAHVVRLVGEDARVLELGPATGYMSRAFSDRGCTVVGIEIDPAMAKRAAEFCERIVVGDLDTLDLEKELGEERFDAIVAADVIEHLKDPLSALTRLRPFLKPDGCFVLSVPNVAHGSVRLALLSGRFEYQKLGLLDSTHLRFFTRETLEQLLDDAELGVVELHRHELNLDASEVPFDPAVASEEVRAELERDPDARTYQFVVKAIPMEREGLREVRRRLRELVHLRCALDDAHDRLRRREAEAERCNERRAAEKKTLLGEIDDLRAENVRLQVRLDRIVASPPMRIYAALRTLPGGRAVQRRRQAGFEAEVARRTGQSP